MTIIQKSTSFILGQKYKAKIKSHTWVKFKIRVSDNKSIVCLLIIIIFQLCCIDIYPYEPPQNNPQTHPNSNNNWMSGYLNCIKLGILYCHVDLNSTLSA